MLFFGYSFTYLSEGSLLNDFHLEEIHLFYFCCFEEEPKLKTVIQLGHSFFGTHTAVKIKKEMVANSKDFTGKISTC
jgi:hypothetical protein